MSDLKAFRDWSIRQKLIGLFFAMALSAATTVAVPMGIFDFFGLRHAMVRDMATLADALARNTTAALIFQDAKAARDVLEALRAEPSVSAACIYDNDGTPLATYVRQGEIRDWVPPVQEKPSARFERDQMIEFREIALNGERVGTIYIQSDLQRLNRRLRQYIGAIIATFAITLVLSIVIADRLQRPISSPLARLVKTAGTISNASDYSIRVELATGDEFGLLGSALNEMLDQIQKRDEQLRQHRQVLAEEVASRTAELRMANMHLRQAEEKYRAIFEDAVIGIFQMTPEGRPISVNRALAQIHGYESPESFMAAVQNVAQEVFVHPSQMNELRALVEEKGLLRDVEIELYRRDQTTKWVLANIRGVRNSLDQLAFLEGTIEDITDRKHAEEQVQFLAYYDALTGLPNRTLLQDRLGKALASARRRDEKVGLLFLDLDRFKFINDSLGHSFGDLLLREVAVRLENVAREQDTVARIGGDEFLIALTGLKDIPDVAIVAERIMDAMVGEFVIQDRRFNISCSIGISMFPDHGDDSETLIKNADAAMYSAKESGRNAFRFFSEDMNAQVVERLSLENGLRTALQNGELFLVYQSQIDIASHRLVGLEALLRWQHPEMGMVSPDKFIRVAENSGLIMPIGEWVLRTACSAARQWQMEGLPPVPIAVNVSAVQFRQEGFRDVIERVLQEAGLEPRYLELELTESLLLSNAEVTRTLLQQLKAMGVKLAIDDFGTGYSSLAYLRHFPVSKLKIDRSFIRNVASNPDDAAITTAIISMAKGLNLRVIAEGVENEAQMSFLRSHRCDEVQGFYFSKPLTFRDLLEQMRTSMALVP